MQDGVLCGGCREEPEFCTCVVSGEEGFFGEVTLDGQPFQLARIRFAKPDGFRQLLNPFAKVEDSSGRRFSVGSLEHKARIIAAAKKGEPMDVLCRPQVEGFKVVRLGLDWLL